MIKRCCLVARENFAQEISILVENLAGNNRSLPTRRKRRTTQAHARQQLQFPTVLRVKMVSLGADVDVSFYRRSEPATKATVNPGIHAADRAYDLALKEGIPLREAYKRVASTLRANKSRYPLQPGFGAFL
jgi:hypothetical protein